MIHRKSGSDGEGTSSRPFWLGNRGYWACQLLGWGGFWIFNRSAQFDQRDYSGESFPADLLIAGWALILTHLYRQLIQLWCWKDLSWTKLWPRVLCASIVLGLVTTFAAALVLGQGVPLRLLPLNRVLFLFAFAGAGQGIVFVGWSAIYFSYQHQKKVRQLERDKIKLRKTMQVSALAALQAQVNPHFLFNSLNVIRALINEDNLRAREAVTQLATIFRASLQFADRDLITLREELEIIEAYLELGKARFQDRLQVQWDIDPITLDFLIPPFLIQTLVENAVKYGIDTQLQGGWIKINCRVEQESFLIQILNDGLLAASADTKGIGLANAREKINLLFGKRASISLSQLEDGVVEAKVVLPQVMEVLK